MKGKIKMSEEKIMNDEMMNNDELEQVAGGTNGEYKEIRKYLPVSYAPISNSCEVDIVIPMRPDEVEEWLKENLNIDAKIDNGAWYNPFDSAGNPNVYSRNGQSLTHAQVVGEVKKFFGK